MKRHPIGDDNEIDAPTFLAKLSASSILPGTAAPPPTLYIPLYQKYAKDGETMLVLTPSAEVSGTFVSATIASKEFPDAAIHMAKKVRGNKLQNCGGSECGIEMRKS